MSLNDLFTEFLITLDSYGYNKEASSILAAVLTSPAQKERSKQIQPEYSKKTQKPELTRPRPKSFSSIKTTPAALITLSRMLDQLYKNKELVENLPQDMKSKLEKIRKLSENAFRYASEETEKEAFLGLGKKDQVKDLQKLLENFASSININSFPPELISKLKELQTAISTEISGRPIEKTIFQKGKEVAQKGVDVAKGVAEKGKEVAQKGVDVAKGVAEKGKEVVQDIGKKYETFQEQRKEKATQIEKEKQEIIQKRDKSVGDLTDLFKRSRNYKNIYPSLPDEIKNIFESMNLGAYQLQVSKTATESGMSKKIVINYLNSIF